MRAQTPPPTPSPKPQKPRTSKNKPKTDTKNPPLLTRKLQKTRSFSPPKKQKNQTEQINHQTKKKQKTKNIRKATKNNFNISKKRKREPSTLSTQPPFSSPFWFVTDHFWPNCLLVAALQPKPWLNLRAAVSGTTFSLLVPFPSLDASSFLFPGSVSKPGPPQVRLLVPIVAVWPRRSPHQPLELASSDPEHPKRRPELKFHIRILDSPCPNHSKMFLFFVLLFVQTSLDDTPKPETAKMGRGPEWETPSARSGRRDGLHDLMCSSTSFQISSSWIFLYSRSTSVVLCFCQALRRKRGSAPTRAHHQHQYWNANGLKKSTHSHKQTHEFEMKSSFAKEAHYAF